MSIMVKEHHVEYTEAGLLVKPVAGKLGAEIEGVNLIDLIDHKDAGIIETIYNLMLRHKVVFFRKQNLDPVQHEAFAALFGTPRSAHPLLPGKKDFPNIFEVDYTIPGVQYPEYENSDKTKFQERGVAWHTDITFIENPPKCSILNGVIIPYAGGDTMWCDQEAAFRSLSKRMKDALRGTMAIHDASEVSDMGMGKGGMSNTGAKIEGINGKEENGLVDHWDYLKRAAQVTARHPVVIVHPETGEESLFINPGFTRRIVDFSKPESDAILQFLFKHTTRYEFTVRHHWTQGDVIFSDNISTQHAVVGDIGHSPRLVNRVTLTGEKLIPAQAS
jgi:taurine dioxygenase